MEFKLLSPSVLDLFFWYHIIKSINYGNKYFRN